MVLCAPASGKVTFIYAPCSSCMLHNPFVVYMDSKFYSKRFLSKNLETGFCSVVVTVFGYGFPGISWNRLCNPEVLGFSLP